MFLFTHFVFLCHFWLSFSWLITTPPLFTYLTYVLDTRYCKFYLLGTDSRCLCFLVNIPEFCSRIWLSYLDIVVLSRLVLNFAHGDEATFGLGPVLFPKYGKILLSTPPNALWILRFSPLAVCDFRYLCPLILTGGSFPGLG